MAINAKITNSSNIKSRISQEGVIQTTTVAMTPAGRILDMIDVDATMLGDGAVLIYNLEEEKFETKQQIDNPNTKIIGGSF